MDVLALLLALNGVAVLLYSSMVGLVLARNLHRGATSEHWHLLHAGGTSRGVMLLALAATIRLARLPETHLFLASGLIVFFVWTSVLAMTLRGLTGEKGFHPGGPLSSRAVFLLYAGGTLALPVGLVWLGAGFVIALT